MPLHLGMNLLRPITVGLALTLLFNCGPGLPACPDGGTTLTYDNFGAAFMTSHCIQCHGTARAEKGITLHTAALVRSFADASNAVAGVGTSMPPRDSAPTTAAERGSLAQWLSCGAP